MTCAAPMVRLGFEGMSQGEYEDMLYGRIMGMLRCAAFLGYQNLVLGAFGCGAFGNDAAVVCDMFCKAMDDFTFSGVKGCDRFNHIDFAVLCSPGKDYNFREFCRNFSHGNCADR
ncbi:MAG: TIGR02452 family protein [Clostridiales bacterium]|nr:TIGR02452 family protein [Clostridiales bacterium]